MAVVHFFETLGNLYCTRLYHITYQKTVLCRQFIPIVFVDNQRCKINPLKTQHCMSFSYQLHVSTKHDHHQAGHKEYKKISDSKYSCVYIFFFSSL